MFSRLTLALFLVLLGCASAMRLKGHEHDMRCNSQDGSGCPNGYYCSWRSPTAGGDCMYKRGLNKKCTADWMCESNNCGKSSQGMQMKYCNPA